MMKTDVLQAALQVMISKEILESFELGKIEEVEGNTRIFYMVEKESRMPQSDASLMNDGYMREVNIASTIRANAQRHKAEKMQVGKP